MNVGIEKGPIRQIQRLGGMLSITFATWANKEATVSFEGKFFSEKKPAMGPAEILQKTGDGFLKNALL